MWLGKSERQSKGLSADFAARETLDATAMRKRINERGPENGTRTRQPRGDGGWGCMFGSKIRFY